MIDLLERHRPEIEAICRRHQVKTLELFGSAAQGNWDPARSDVDFLVEFLPLGPGQHFSCFFDLMADLRGLLGRKVDLVTANAIKNRHFLDGVSAGRQVFYAA